MLTFIAYLIQNLHNMLKQAWSLYYNGFREMPRWGRILWTIILIKLFIMFIIFKLLLMPNYLNTHYDSMEEKSDHVIHELTTKH